MDLPEDVTSALLDIQTRPYYELARSFTDEELMAAIVEGECLGMVAPDLPPILTAASVYEHGAYWAQIVSLAQKMFR